MASFAEFPPAEAARLRYLDKRHSLTRDAGLSTLAASELALRKISISRALRILGFAMGYFINAAIFLEQPSWQNVAEWFPTCSVRGYQHQSRAVWLLDTWEAEKRREHFPFASRAGRRDIAVTSMSPDTARFLREFETLLADLDIGRETRAEVPNGIRYALALSVRGVAPVVFFAGDDEDLDFACDARGGELRRFRCRFGNLTVRCENGAAVLVPDYYPDDGETSPPAGLMKDLRRFSSWQIAPPVIVEGGRRLYGSAIDLWPESAGDPDRMLGWDAFETLPLEFKVVYERLV
jgi:hypothetical protein